MQALVIELFLERAEQAVPEDEHAAVVAVHVDVVLGVVHPVIGGRDEDPLVPAQLRICSVCTQYW